MSFTQLLSNNKPYIENNSEESRYHPISVKDLDSKNDQSTDLTSFQIPALHTLPSSSSSTSNNASIENNNDFQNNNPEPKQKRMQLQHSKAAEIETNNDTESKLE
jgi:hypothetical protein